MPSNITPSFPVSSVTKAEMAELVGGLAHELRNPLSTLIVTLKLLAGDLQDIKTRPEETRRRALEKVDVLRREAERLERLFDDFLNLEHLTVKCIVPAAFEVGAAFVCVYGTERIADTLDQPFDGSSGDTA